MKAEIIAVGTELLLGDILNTNAQYLSKQLAEMGFSVYHQTVIGDNPERLQQAVAVAKQRSDIIVFSGGLGPTADDLTKETVAKAFGDTLVLDETELEKIKNYFSTTCRPCTHNNQKQAYVPTHGGKFENDNGTAPGVYFEDAGVTAILLPGPPKELVPMFEQKVKPFLAKFQNGSLFSVNLNIFGIGESNLEGKVKQFLDMQNPTCALYAKHGEVRLRVTAYADTPEKAQLLCKPTCDKIKAEIGEYVYGTNDDTLESVVVNQLIKLKQTVATAESCTGGMLSQRITNVSGSSQIFECGVCSYANRIKNQILGVSGQTLEQFGAVSEQTAAEMAQGVLKLANSDYGIGITGIAGPTGGTDEKPVGTVFIAVATKQKTEVTKIQSGGRGRNHVRHMACQHALDMLRKQLL